VRSGRQLLLAAGRRCLWVADQVGSAALLIDAKDLRVADWYVAYGAVALLDAPLSICLPLKTVEAALWLRRGRSEKVQMR